MMQAPTTSYAIVMSYIFSNEWMQLPAHARRAFEEEHIFPILGKYSDKMTMKSFDADAFSTKTSDFMIVETESLTTFYAMVEELRDSKLLAYGYARISDLLVGVNNEYKRADLRSAA